MSIATKRNDCLPRRQPANMTVGNVPDVESAARTPTVYFPSLTGPEAPTERKPVTTEPFIPEPLLDTDQAAAIIRVHPKTLQRYAREGIVRGFQLGTMWRFSARDIDRWISERMAS
jgi:excisionase family DNA binding protein